jgi:DNA ligase (NAD+)
MSIKNQCELYLKYKYEYYIIGTSSISDYEFDVFETDLRSTGDKLAINVTDLVDFPSLAKIAELGLNINHIAPYYKVKRDEKDYDHPIKMLSTQKIKVVDEDNLPYKELSSFLNRANAKSYQAEPKYDGNGLEGTYENKKLKQILTRGSEDDGKDKTKKLSFLFPKTISIDGTVVIRGEVVTNVKYWKEHFSKNDPKNPDNPRNWVAGIINKEDYIIKELNALTYIAFDMIKLNKNNEKEFILEPISQLKKEGFNKKHDPFIMKIHSINDFDILYKEFKAYRKVCEFMIDGIVIKYPEKFRNELGENQKCPKWNVAIKFKPKKTITTIIDIIWTSSKTNELCPVAILEPVELLGTMVRRCSLYNLGFIINKKAFIGSKISLVKGGDIIPKLVEVLEESPNQDEYMKQYSDFLEK